MRGLRWNRLRRILLYCLIIAAVLPASAKADSVVTPEEGLAYSRLLLKDAALLQETERIDDPETPLAGPAWALLNLILALAIAIISLLMFVGWRAQKKRRAEGAIVRERLGRGVLRLLTLIPGLGGILFFILTENMRQPMIFTDRWTLPMVLVATIQIVLVLLSGRRRQIPGDAPPEQAMDDPEVF